jgi:hypothetical protein
MNGTITISAKCSDAFWAALQSPRGVRVAEYDGYVPRWFGRSDDGDYVALDIDLETGKILNWKTPTKANIKETFKVSL